MAARPSGDFRRGGRRHYRTLYGALMQILTAPLPVHCVRAKNGVAGKPPLPRQLLSASGLVRPCGFRGIATQPAQRRQSDSCRPDTRRSCRRSTWRTEPGSIATPSSLPLPARATIPGGPARRPSRTVAPTRTEATRLGASHVHLSQHRPFFGTRRTTATRRALGGRTTRRRFIDKPSTSRYRKIRALAAWLCVDPRT